MRNCYESNRMHHFLKRYVYNRDVFVLLDSTVGMFVAVTELGAQPPETGTSRGSSWSCGWGTVDVVCRHNYELDRAFTLEHRGGQGGQGKASRVDLGQRRACFLSHLQAPAVPGWVTGIQRA